MKHGLLVSSVVVGAMAFVGHQAQSCSSSNGGLGHLSTSTSTSGDASCIFNVDVSIDYDSGDSSFGSAAVLADIEGALTGQGDGTAVNVIDNGGYADDPSGEGTVSFVVPQGTGEVSITVESADGIDASGSMNLSNGTFTPSSGAGGGCTPPPPPSLPVNPMPPEPGQPVQSDSQPDVSDSLGSGVPAGDDSAPGGQNPQQAAVQ